MGFNLQGFAARGADIYADQAAVDARTAAEIEKAQRIEEIKHAAELRNRAENMARVSAYAAPVTTTQTGSAAATLVDDEGNSNAPNDLKTTRPANLDEIGQRAIAAGDMDAAKNIHGMAYQDAVIDARNQASENRLEGTKYAADVRKAAQLGAAGMRWLNPDGTPKVGTAIQAGALKGIRDDIMENNSNARDLEKSITSITDPAKMMLLNDDQKKAIMADVAAKKDAITALRSMNSRLTDQRNNLAIKLGVPLGEDKLEEPNPNIPGAMPSASGDAPSLPVLPPNLAAQEFKKRFAK